MHPSPLTLMFRCVFVFIFCLSQLTLAQRNVSTDRYDSLVRALKTSSTDTASIKLYHLLSANAAESNPKQVLLYEDSALAIAKRIKSEKFIAITLTNIGSHYRKISEFQKSYSYLLEAMKASPPSSKWLGQTYLESGITLLRMSELDSAMHYVVLGLDFIKKYPDASLEASFYNVIGNIRREQNDFNAALDNYIKAAKLFEQQKNLRGLTQALSNVGNIHNLMDDTEKALDYAIQSLEAAKAANVKSSIAYSYRLMGRIYRKQKKLDDALKAYENAAGIYQASHSRRELAETKQSIGNIYFDKRQFENALREYQETIGIDRKIQDTLGMGYTYIAVAETLVQLKQYQKAKDYFDTTIFFATKKKLLPLVMDSYGVLSEIYEREGNYKLASVYYKRYIVLKDSVAEVQNRKAAAELEARYQSEKKDDAIRILNAENELKATQIRSKNNERNYLLLSLGLSVLLVGIIYNRYKVKLKANAKLQELDQIKSRFFTNVSHEFRTPLSLIIGPLEEKLDKPLDLAERENLLLMHRNAKRLQNLTNQVLDLSRLEAGSMDLHLQEGDLSAAIKFICSTFLSLAESKGLSYHQDIFEGPFNACYDRDKLEKMLNNLLSNAFKFTPEGGSVNLKAFIDAGKLVVEIKDSGVGIPADKLGLIFNRFYQVDDSINRSSEGSGIGLALTKELAELHRGKLEVISQEGFGSTFTLFLSVSKEAFKDLVIVPETTQQELMKIAHFSDQGSQFTAEDESKPLVLVAEDNADMRKFIFDLLNNKYRVVCVNNGKEAFEKAKDIVPDLVITDWMMPVMDGITCCEKLKTADATCHIPVLMLTARADQPSKLEGLETGADDYLVKPFNTTELAVRSHNLIEQRRKLREKFSKEMVLQPQKISLPGRDATFLSNLLALLEKNYAEPEFTVDELSDEVNMSRMQLHRKLKALTDQSPGEFLRKFRLERAKQLLSIEGTQVSEACFKVGFNNVSHFSKSFREFTGVTPTEFIESIAVKK